MMRRSIRDKELAIRKSSVRIDERARHLNMDVCSDATLAEFVYIIGRYSQDNLKTNTGPSPLPFSFHLLLTLSSLPLTLEVGPLKCS